MGPRTSAQGDSAKGKLDTALGSVDAYPGARSKVPPVPAKGRPRAQSPNEIPVARAVRTMS